MTNKLYKDILNFLLKERKENSREFYLTDKQKVLYRENKKGRLYIILGIENILYEHNSEEFMKYNKKVFKIVKKKKGLRNDK
jgi:hypothetical protein